MFETRKKKGYVYILMNSSLDYDLLKIGQTSRDPYERAKEISSSTGVAVPYQCIYFVESFDCSKLEKNIHSRLKSCRYSKNREFFKIKPVDAIKILEEEKQKLDQIEDIKINLEIEINQKYLIDYNAAINDLMSIECNNHLEYFLKQVNKILNNGIFDSELRFAIQYSFLQLYLLLFEILEKFEHHSFPLFDLNEISINLPVTKDNIIGLINMVGSILSRIFNAPDLILIGDDFTVDKYLINVIDEYINENEVLEEFLFSLIKYLDGYIFCRNYITKYVQSKESTQELLFDELELKILDLFVEHDSGFKQDNYFALHFLSASFLCYLSLSGNTWIDINLLDFLREEISIDIKKCEDKINQYFYNTVLLFLDFPDFCNELVFMLLEEELLKVHNKKLILEVFLARPELRRCLEYQEDIILKTILSLKNDFDDDELYELISKLVL